MQAVATLSFPILSAIFGASLALAQANPPANAFTSGWPAGTIINEPLKGYEAAAKQGKPLTIFFGADWCKRCIALKTDALSHPDFVGLWTRGIFLVLDVERDDAYGNTKNLMTRLGAKEYPMIAVLDVMPDKVNLRGRIIGFHTPVQLCGSLRSVDPIFFADGPITNSGTGCRAPTPR